MRKKKPLCLECKNNPRPGGGGYCKAHHAAYMREWRKTHRLTGEARAKMNARAYLNVYIKRGKILKQSCQTCGAPAQAHHPDYSKPLEVIWLCKHHHGQIHAKTYVPEAAP